MESSKCPHCGKEMVDTSRQVGDNEFDGYECLECETVWLPFTPDRIAK